MATRNDLPSTLKRSARRAQDTYTKALDSATASYGAGDRARRTAITAVKRSFDSIGDKWVPKAGKGPSSAQTGRRRSTRPASARGGIDANASKEHLMDVAGKMGISGRWRMNKADLVDAIRKTDNRSTRAVSRRSDVTRSTNARSTNARSTGTRSTARRTRASSTSSR